MHIQQIGTRITARADHGPGDVPLDHGFRRRWWLPVIGPTATVLVDYLVTLHTDDGWQIHDVVELGTALGVGRGTGINSPVIRTFGRLARYGFGRFDIEADNPVSDPCITLWATIPVVPERLTQRWPTGMQRTHAEALAALHRAAA